MNPIYQALFETYGDHILREAEAYNEDEINDRLADLSLDPAVLPRIDNLFFDYYYRWSVNAFSLGLHLGLSLLHDNVRRVRPQQADQIPR